MPKLTLLYKSFVFILFVFVWLRCGDDVEAAPTFSISGSTSIATGTNSTYTVYLDTDGNTLTAIQAVIEIEAGFFNAVSYSISGSACSIWTPQDSSTPPVGTFQGTPYFYNQYVVLSCGFSNPGKSGSNLKIGTFTISPYQTGTATLSVNTTYSKALFIGSPIALGAMSNLDVVISGAVIATPTPTPSGGPTATNTPTPTITPTGTVSPSPTPTNTVTPTPTATPTTGTATATPTPTTTTATSSGEYSLSADDINFVTLAPRPDSTTSTGTDDATALDDPVEEDNTVPPPPEITPRPPATPFPTPDPNAGIDEGEVLAVQSIRELLIPGKSEADRKVVLFNFLSILTLISVIAVIAWRLIMTRRAQSIKKLHLSDLLTSELAAIESKLNVIDDDGEAGEIKKELESSVQSILEELNHT